MFQMQLISTFDETVLDVLTSFYIEGCMLLVAMICFRLLHRKWSESLKSSKDVLPQRAVKGKKRQSDGAGFSEKILACGRTHDVDRARKLWGEATATETFDEATLESFVDVLVTCKCTKEAWAVAKQIWEDPKQSLQTSYHTVKVYSALLRGFSKGEEHEQVYALYLEMQERSVPMNTISYNVVLSSLLRLGQMCHIPALLVAMRIEGSRGAPDTCTYATIVKGYCNIGDVDSALELLDHMIEQRIKLDEFTFNNLLNGCAKYHRTKDALRLLQLMDEHGVPPSNCTISIAVKVLSRAHRLSDAFHMAE